MTAPVDLPQLTTMLERATQGSWEGSHGGCTEQGNVAEIIEAPGQHGHKLIAYGQMTRNDRRLIVAAISALPALIAELTAARERLAGEGERMMREALLWADEHADDQDMNHVNFRVGAGSRARTALATLTKDPH